MTTAEVYLLRAEECIKRLEYGWWNCSVLMKQELPLFEQHTYQSSITDNVKQRKHM
jgi:hypothetical protein